MPSWLLRCALCSLLLLPTTGSALNYDQYDDLYAYFSGGLHSWSEEVSDASAEGLKVRFGQQLTSFVAVEAHLAFGGSDEDVSLDRLFGLYAQFGLPLNYFTPYAKVGMTSVSLSDGDNTRSDFEFGYGVGAELNITRQFFIDLEYMRYLETDDVDMDAFTLSLGYRLR
ncbi:porin family protein [Marinospirillum sp. MEB164]|uniref:Porin family protein n=1 Tax=Marinospirillum alkalitolerans TaxID=3123374 RepID=A0ABW8PWR9_9GAMM